jgi:mono/diheme cytochrome c family protein
MSVPGKILGLMLMVTPTVAAGQEIGDVVEGRRYASDVCSQCHAVSPGALLSPLMEAPPFEEIAKTPGMTAVALRVWFQSSHPTMPNIVMKDAEMRDVIQYILSLKDQ